MTPAINITKQNKVDYKIHEYQHDSSNESYGLEAADKLNVPEAQVFKTLVVSLNNNELAIGVIPVSSLLSMKLFAKIVGAKKAEMAPQIEAERSTGYIMGGVSPLGQKKKLKTIIDSSAKNLTTIYVSAGKRGLEIELRPFDLIKLTNGTFADISQ
jgi:Cys-tRNA(Pro)/Cys-tRNA(Cys) deacylase